MPHCCRWTYSRVCSFTSFAIDRDSGLILKKKLLSVSFGFVSGFGKAYGEGKQDWESFLMEDTLSMASAIGYLLLTIHYGNEK